MNFHHQWCHFSLNKNHHLLNRYHSSHNLGTMHLLTFGTPSFGDPSLSDSSFGEETGLLLADLEGGSSKEVRMRELILSLSLDFALSADIFALGLLAWGLLFFWEISRFLGDDLGFWAIFFLVGDCSGRKENHLHSSLNSYGRCYNNYSCTCTFPCACV